MIKTVNLTANQEFAVELQGGCHCCVENRGDSVIYASASAGVTADADGVTAISSGSSKILRNVARYEKSGDTYDYYGKIYLLSTSKCKAEIQTADDLNFFSRKNSVKGGGSSSSEYDDTEIKNRISAVETGKVDKETGKALSSNNYTTEEKEKLAELSNYDDTELQNRLLQLEDYSYVYSGSSAERKNYYYLLCEITVTGTATFESIQTVLALRPVAVINANSAKFGVIQIQGRYDQNNDGNNDNTFTVINVNWVLSSNIQTDKFIVAYNNDEKKIRLYYKSSSTYDGFVAQKILADITSPTASPNPTVLIKDTVGVESIPDGWIVVSSEASTASMEE